MDVHLTVSGWTAEDYEHEHYADENLNFTTDILPIVGDVIAFLTEDKDGKETLWSGCVTRRVFNALSVDSAIGCVLEVEISGVRDEIGGG